MLRLALAAGWACLASSCSAHADRQPENLAADIGRVLYALELSSELAYRNDPASRRSLEMASEHFESKVEPALRSLKSRHDVLRIEYRFAQIRATLGTTAGDQHIAALTADMQGALSP